MGAGAKVRGMTAKELLLQEVAQWTEHDAEVALRAVKSEHEDKPDDIIDGWGNLSAMKRRSSARLMKRLSEEEIAANGETLAESWGYEQKHPQ